MTSPNRAAVSLSRCSVCSARTTPLSRAAARLCSARSPGMRTGTPSCSGCAGLAALREKIHLFQKGRAPGEGVRIENLQEDIAAPALLRVLAAESRQALGERFDHQREAEAFVAVLEPAQQQQAAARVGLLEHARIAGRPAGGVEQPGLLERLTGWQPSGVSWRPS